MPVLAFVRRGICLSRHLPRQMPGAYFWTDKCQEGKCQDPISMRTNARTIFWADECKEDKCQDNILGGQMPGAHMPGPYFGEDKCQEKNARTIILAGQMPRPYFGPDKCQEGPEAPQANFPQNFCQNSEYF